MARAGRGGLHPRAPDSSADRCPRHAEAKWPGARRRGIASALSAYLAWSAHSQAISLVFLEAEPEAEQLYRRTGFADATTKIWASLR
ncbi:MAG: GNAT family N-acetyltransferase [Trebonia sp.]